MRAQGRPDDHHEHDVVGPFQNTGAQDAKFLAVATPGVMSPDYFREIHEILAASGGGPPDPAKLREVMRRHGLAPAPPS